jgi:tetratricopeptide (TPR) repeat protein
MNSRDFRFIHKWLLAVILSLAICTGVSAKHYDTHDERTLREDPRLAPGQLAPVLEGLGDHHHQITANSDRAQFFFDQGLKLTYGFNHKEALRSFKEAARVDPGCAMAYWGWALVLGPNLNLPMSPEVVEQAYEAIQLALARKANVTQKERDYINALTKRYTNDPQADRAPLDVAYAEAMGKLHAKYPDDPDAATLYAAALMNLSPWNYWTKDGRPRKHTRTILEALESALERDPEHEGALHYYIHAVEPVDADRGVKAADSLRNLAPGAGHLVHMPTHIYMQLGRYTESFELNALAAKADEDYITQCRAQGIYPLNYYPHNVHFQTWAALMLGNSEAAIEAARKVAAKVPQDLHGNDWALYQTFLSMPLYSYVRFAKWEVILGEPAPHENLRFLTGIWHYARGMAFTHTTKLQKAQVELLKLTAISQNPAVHKEPIGFGNAEILLTIAREILAGELAAKKGSYNNAISHLERAVRLEDSLTYNEPPDWYYPVRHTLGAVLLEAGYPVEAEVVYWEDLRKYRDNGYSLYGLWQSFKAQGRSEEAERIKTKFQKVWENADIMLSSSRF